MARRGRLVAAVIVAGAVALGVVVALARNRTSSPASTPTTAAHPSTTGTPTPRPPNTTTSVSPVTEATGPTFVAPATIPSSCGPDATDALNRWIASVPNNRTIRLRAGACYRIAGTVQLVRRARLILDGAGATLRAEPVAAGTTTDDRDRVTVSIFGGHDIVVRDLTVVGTLPPGKGLPHYDARFEAQHGFAIGGATRVRLAHVHVTNVRGDFVYIGPRGSHRPAIGSDGVSIVDSTFDRAGRQGIAITIGHDIDIEGNTLSNVARSIFDLEPNATRDAIRDVRIAGNTTGAAHNYWFANKAPGAMDIGGITIARNVMRDRTGGLMLVLGLGEGARGPFTITDNHFLVPSDEGQTGKRGTFFFSHTDGIMISRNSARFPRDDLLPVIDLRSCDHVRIHDNPFIGANTLVAADRASRDVITG